MNEVEAPIHQAHQVRIFTNIGGMFFYLLSILRNDLLLAIQDFDSFEHGHAFSDERDGFRGKVGLLSRLFNKILRVFEENREDDRHQEEYVKRKQWLEDKGKNVATHSHTYHIA